MTRLRTWLPVIAALVVTATLAVAGGAINVSSPPSSIVTADITTANVAFLDAGSGIVGSVSMNNGNASAAKLTLTAAQSATALHLDNRALIEIGVNAGGNPVYLQATGGGMLFLVGGGVAGAGGFISDAPSGSVAFQANTTGAKIALSSAGTDTLVGNGSTITTGAGLVVTGKATVAANSGTCTLDGATPSKCNVTVTASAKCVCSVISALGAAPCTKSLTSTTLTVYSAAGLTNDVDVICDR